jgi:SAM-dependent methyltransferase
MEHPLALTGERTLPGIPEENYWFQRHVVAYRFAAQRAAGKAVLDAGCGEGYGTAMLSGVAAQATGVDLAAEAVAHARTAYPEATFVEANLVELPAEDASVDLVVSFQVIEHLWDIPRFLDEVARVLRPGGEFLCATPNRLTFPPGNPFHTVEYSPAELAATLATRFEVSGLFGVQHGWRLRAVERLTRRPLTERQTERPAAEWPRWLRRTVAAVTSDDFRLRVERTGDCLDILAVAVRRA